jgi:hypothetical protein
MTAMNWRERFRRTTPQNQVNIVCTIIVMFATIVYAGFSVRQFFVMNDQLKQMKNALAQDETHFRLDERPYVTQTVRSTAAPEWHQNPYDAAKGQIVWDWHMTNYGKTPAQNVTFTQEIRIDGIWYPSHGEKEPDVGPPLVQGQDVFDTVVSDVMTKAEFDRLMQTTDGVAARIKIHYTGFDAVTPYDTALCFARTNAGSIPYCKTDNYIH